MRFELVLTALKTRPHMRFRRPVWPEGMQLGSSIDFEETKVFIYEPIIGYTKLSNLKVSDILAEDWEEVK